MGEPGIACVLLVDDDHTMLSVLVEQVRACGYQAFAAATFGDALQLFRARRPDLVLLDVMMPTLDGYKLARMLKQESSGFVPIILLTALGDIDSKRRGMAAGADDFLTKPVGQVELEIRLASMLRIKTLTDEIHAANTKLAEIAVTDPLTGICNRRALYEQLAREFERSKRHGHPFSVFLMDIDHFKNVNDTFGHGVGDRVLVSVASALSETIRSTDSVGRYGGEEFVVLAPETSSAQARLLGERLRCQVAQVTGAEPDAPEVTISVGIASSDVVRVSRFDEMLELADNALYEAKDAGRNRCVSAPRMPE